MENSNTAKLASCAGKSETHQDQLQERIIGNVLGVEMSTVAIGAGELWHAHVSEPSDNDQAAITQIKELKEVLNGQCDVIGFSGEEVESMCDICRH